MKPELAPIAKRIASAQERSGLTQRKFAEAAGLSLATFRRYISADTDPSFTKLERIAEIGGVDLGWLVTGSGDTENAAGIGPAQRLQIRTLARQALVLITTEADRQGLEITAEKTALIQSELITDALARGRYDLDDGNVAELFAAARAG